MPVDDRANPTSSVILAVSPNLALDVTYDLPSARWDAANRVSAVTHRAGGKGVNVARVLHARGHSVAVSGCAGGATGAAIRADLAAAGLPDRTVSVAGDSRRTLVVSETQTGRATGFWEPGPEITRAEWRALCDAVAAALPGCAAVVLAGSLPPGAPADGYAALVRLARDAGVPVVLDADGEALRAGVAAGPDVCKPNADELRAVSGDGLGPAAAARALLESGAGAVVASLGSDGLLAVTAAGAWRVAPPERVTGNATGAGDAVVAALAEGLVTGSAWPDRLAEAVALSAAAVAHPVAGAFDPLLYADFRARATVEPA